MADANLRWAMSTFVKSVETVQAMILMTYWGPTHARQCDDPYWLRLSHATQLARELGIGKTNIVRERAALLEPTNSERRERQARNMERTWLYVFIADKSFGITTGRAMCFSWKEIPDQVAIWWQNPGTTELDRMICGIVEMRVLVVKSLEHRRLADLQIAAVLAWRHQTCEDINHLQQGWSQNGPLPGSISSAVLKFYFDYNLLLVNTLATGDLLALGSIEALAELANMFEQNAVIAMRLIDLVLTDESLLEFKSGLHNTQVVMICHVASELLNGLKRGLPEAVVRRAGPKIRAMASHLEQTACTLPDSSWVYIYAGLFQVFVSQFEELSRVQSSLPEAVSCPEHGFNENPYDDWWNSLNMDSTEISDFINMSCLSPMGEVQ
ncbi:hypothetical protein KC331_g9825 [Hortaea werneckii]|nr:hypothetical protein KC331_g9825 [Hortaea werneckii]